jgi:lysophospholipase L1-like esterase
MTLSESLLLRPDDSRLTWQGVVSLECAKEWVAPWRLPHRQRGLFPPERLQERARMPAGVRIAFHSDTTVVAGQIADPDPELSSIDLCCDGQLVGSVELAGRDAFCFQELLPGPKETELWLPQFGIFRLRTLELSAGATLYPFEDSRPRWITYGSSITQCRAARSPTWTWPAIVARTLGLNLTCLGFGGECHLDTMVARMVRDLPADVISLCLGINVFGGASLSPRTFRPAIIGFVQTLREGHPDSPLIVVSPIYSPPREGTPNVVGLSLATMRQEIETAVRTLQEHGDTNIYYVDGLSILGPDHAHLLPDDLHPNAEGYKLMGRNLSRIFTDILAS